MILIADSGSTKTDWALINGDHSVVRFASAGMNPNTTPDAELEHLLSAQETLLSHRQDIQRVYFYGAGCTGAENIRRMQQLLSAFFSSASVTIHSDMTGAVHAVRTGNEPCITGILGTGANSCYFNGASITGLHFSPGFIIGDEGSGAWIGKRLLRDYTYQIMPHTLRELFAQQFDLERSLILQGVYRSAAPGAYLGSFAPFALEHMHDAYIQALLQEGIQQYIQFYICRFTVSHDVAVHMIGGIAWRLQEMITAELHNKGMRVGKFIQTPMEGLIALHIQEAH